MSKSSHTHNSGGIGFAGLLTIVFITLKLLGEIDWSWWWVLSPIWISALVPVSVFVLAFVLFLIFDWRRRGARTPKAPLFQSPKREPNVQPKA